MTDQPPVDLMDYASMTQTALRGVVRQALVRAASKEGLPSEHHFFVTFLTRAPGVSIPDDLLARYPYEITIVLQHQFRDLRVADDFFRVTLTFGGFPKILTVPFAAVSRFHDPFAQFMLEFEADDALTQDLDGDMTEETDEATIIDVIPQPSETKRDDAPAAEGETPPPDAPKIVSLDQFRKK